MVVCNKCGKALQEKNSIVREDYLHICTEWGYFSKKDGLIWEIDLCEECADKFEKELKIPAKKEIKTEFI